MELFLKALSSLKELVQRYGLGRMGRIANHSILDPFYWKSPSAGLVSKVLTKLALQHLPLGYGYYFYGTLGITY